MAQPPAYTEKPPVDQGYPPQQPGYPPPQQPGYPPPQQPGYPPQQGYPPPQPGQTVVVQPSNVVVAGVVSYGEFPTNTVCSACHATVMTSVEFVTGTLTWLIAGILFLVGCWLCCWIPCVVDGCKDVIHKCPNCHNVVGQFRRI